MLQEQPASSPRREKLFQLIGELRKVRAELKQAEESDTAWFFTDADNNAAIEALKREKNRVAEEIRELEKDDETSLSKKAK